MIEPETGSFLPDHAKYVLSLGFSDAEKARYLELADKVQDGALTSEEEAELDDFITANTLLIILQSKARRSLNKSSSAA